MKTIAKVLIASIFSISLLFAHSPVLAFDEQVDTTETTFSVWDGTSEISWYTGNQTSYELNSARDLAGFASLVNSGIFDKTGITVNLNVNVDLNEIEWIPIGGSNLLENVTFNGNGKIIKGLKITSDSISQKGLFGWVKNSQFNNVIVIDANIVSNNGGYVGVIVADAISSSVFQSYASGNIDIVNGNAADAVGGVVGQYYSDDNYDGYIRETGSNVNINGKISGQYGGIIAWVSTYNNSLFEISNSYYSGNLNVSSQGSATSGVAGLMVSIVGYGFPNLPVGRYEIRNTYVSGEVVNSQDTPSNSSSLGIALIDGTVSSSYWPEELAIDGVQQMTWDVNLGDFVDGNGVTTNTNSISRDDMKTSNFLALINSDAKWGFVRNNSDNLFPLLQWQLEFFGADYSLVNEAIAKVPVDSTKYTTDSWNALNTEIGNIVYSKKASEQNLVDFYATKILSAIERLEIKEFKVNFITGHSDTSSEITIKYGDSIKVPNTPSLVGHIFVGWFTDDQYTDLFDFSKPVTTNLNIYAKFVEETPSKKYIEVKFLGFDGNIITYQKILEGDKVVRPVNPTFDGYTFLGWSTEEKSISYFDFETRLESNQVLYSIWEKNVTTNPEEMPSLPNTGISHNVSLPFVFSMIGFGTILIVYSRKKYKK